MGLVQLIQDPASPSSLGTGPAQTPNLLTSGIIGERNAELTSKAAVQRSRDIAKESQQTGHGSKIVSLISSNGKKEESVNKPW